ncbi:ParB-like nuclease domain protein [Poriferisphaera corsica]|uniref:ParB-like nuclease domain protein n=1 Tax=Poriferisphaera corsica TaxID=2528020 RepID=A0A517YZE3_9BACT|nr:ParB N-terminal domain-containing protein [Poriferisphaera corsica]QDU35569.1 ParB-like nuclease domain protein [Poriferisphaera corsica]
MDKHRRIRLARLVAHPLNSNVMDGEKFEKLKGHMDRTGKYPPIIVRVLNDRRLGCKHPSTGGTGLVKDVSIEGLDNGVLCDEFGAEMEVTADDLAGEPGRIDGRTYEILDGHHRVEAIRALGWKSAACVVWDVDDDEALTLLATLNRLSGEDDVLKRGQLVKSIAERMGEGADLRGKLAALLPENREGVSKLLEVAEERVRMRRPMALGEMPRAVHFFLKAEDKRQLEKRLKEIGGSREAALMSLIC